MRDAPWCVSTRANKIRRATPIGVALPFTRYEKMIYLLLEEIGHGKLSVAQFRLRRINEKRIDLITHQTLNLDFS